MQLHTFVADSVPDAVAQIREQLGGAAVVVSVRKLPVSGLGRLFHSPRIEVQAGIPDPVPDPLAEIKQQLAELRREMESRETVGVDPGSKSESRREIPFAEPPPFQPESPPMMMVPTAVPRSNGGIGMLLENTGIMPLYTASLTEQLRQGQRGLPPQSLMEEIDGVCSLLKTRWRPATATQSQVHIFIGPAGSGKTTFLCKWLARAVLVDERRAKVWRLDSTVANAAESLSVYAEILGVPVERFPSNEELEPGQMLFIDLPGINVHHPGAVEGLAKQLRDLPKGQLHLVLNAAYESRLLMAQARAFDCFDIQDVNLTHLDEETQWGKLWNLVLGTKFPMGFLGAGQNIPGDLRAASPELFFNRQFAHR